jgi:hypothetical protein
VLDASHAILLQNANILDWRHVTYALIKKRKRDIIGMRQGGERGREGEAAGEAAAGFAGRSFRIDSGFGENYQNEFTCQIISMQHQEL